MSMKSDIDLSTFFVDCMDNVIGHPSCFGDGAHTPRPNCQKIAQKRASLVAAHPESIVAPASLPDILSERVHLIYDLTVAVPVPRVLESLYTKP